MNLKVLHHNLTIFRGIYSLQCMYKLRVCTRKSLIVCIYNFLNQDMIAANVGTRQTSMYFTGTKKMLLSSVSCIHSSIASEQKITMFATETTSGYVPNLS